MNGRTAFAGVFAVLLLVSVAAGQPVGNREDSLRAPPGNPDVESLLRLPEAGTATVAVLDRLLVLQEHPLDLNRATADELEAIPGVSGQEARAVTALRTAIGGFRNAGELDSLSSLFPALAARLQPYVTVTPAGRESRRGAPGMFILRSRCQQDLQLRSGFLDGSYRGTRLNAYQRFGLDIGEGLEIGGLAEKDAGEPWNQGFTSGFVDLSAEPWETRVIAGDFLLGAGQGLVCWQATSFERGNGAGAFVRRTGGGLDPSRSSGESAAMRGIAVSVTPVRGFQALGFFSSRDRAGSLNDAGEITSFNASGLYRTDSEIRNRHAVHERTLGGRLHAAHVGPASIGVTLLHTELSRPLVPDRTREFRGRILSLAGADGFMETGDVLWFAEVARTAGGGGAAVAGAVASIGLRTEAALAWRSYGVDYATLYGAGFGQGEDTRNEQGFSLAVSTQAGRWLRLHATFDRYHHPWHTPLRSFPSSGSETLVEALIRPRPHLEVAARYILRSSEVSQSGTDPLGRPRSPQELQTRHALRFTLSVEPDRHVRFRSRLELVDVRVSGAGARERGFLLYEDITWSVASGLTVEGRLAFFDTESYDARVYAYENDLRGAFANPPLYGKGRRWYLLARGEVIEGVLTFSCKYSATQKDGVRMISSGDAGIIGDLDDRFGCQLDLRF